MIKLFTLAVTDDQAHVVALDPATGRELSRARVIELDLDGTGVALVEAARDALGTLYEYAERVAGYDPDVAERLENGTYPHTKNLG